MSLMVEFRNVHVASGDLRSVHGKTSATPLVQTMTEFQLTRHPHRRFNPLTGEWVLVSPHRTERPWQGQVEETQRVEQPVYDPDCYLCPGNARAGGVAQS